MPHEIATSPAAGQASFRGDRPESSNRIPKLPRNLRNFQHFIWTKDPPVRCTCNQCYPEIYGPRTCRFGQRHLSLDSNMIPIRNKFSNAAFQLPALSPGSHESLWLAEMVIEYFNRPWQHLNDTQIVAREHMRNFIVGKPAIYNDIQEKDGAKIIIEAEMRLLFKWFNEFFFAGDRPEYTFKYATGLQLNGRKKRGIASAFSQPTIVMEPLKSDTPKYTDMWGLHMVSTLLHETIHVFIDHYTCRSCKSNKFNLNAQFHGRSWQLVAIAVEEVFQREFGLPINLNRWDNYISNLRVEHELPSTHDLSRFMFETRSERFGNHADVKKLLEGTLQVSYPDLVFGWRSKAHAEAVSRRDARQPVRKCRNSEQGDEDQVTK